MWEFEMCVQFVTFSLSRALHLSFFHSFHFFHSIGLLLFGLFTLDSMCFNIFVLFFLSLSRTHTRTQPDEELCDIFFSSSNNSLCKLNRMCNSCWYARLGFGVWKQIDHRRLQAMTDQIGWSSVPISFRITKNEWMIYEERMIE